MSTEQSIEPYEPSESSTEPSLDDYRETVFARACPTCGMQQGVACIDADGEALDVAHFARCYEDFVMRYRDYVETVYPAVQELLFHRSLYFLDRYGDRQAAAGE